MGVRTVKPKTAVIDRIRASKGWRLADLAHHADISERTLNNVMAGKEALVGTMRRIAAALGVKFEEIVDDDLMAQLSGFPPSALPGLAAMQLRAGRTAENASRQEEKPYEKTYEVRFKLSIPISDFSYEYFMTFLKMLARLLGGDIMDADVKEGSTLVIVQLTEAQIRSLMEMLPNFKDSAKAREERLDDPSGKFLSRFSGKEGPSLERSQALTLIEKVESVTLPSNAFVPADKRGQEIPVTK